MMRQILQNETAQKIIDYVSPVYGDSYVGLWIYEAIGAALNDICILAEDLRYETIPMTTETLMDYWEDHYGLHRNSDLNMEQRRFRLLDKIRSRAPCNPERLADSLEAVLFVPVEIIERVAKNTFRVNVKAGISDFQKMLHAIYVLERRKPAHLIYEFNVETQVDETDLKLATAITQSESYSVGVDAVKLVLETTLEKAIKLGAAVSVGEEFRVEPRNVSVETTTNLEYNALTASPVSSREVYSVAEIKQVARIAVEKAFNLASSVSNKEEFTIEEVSTQ